MAVVIPNAGETMALDYLVGKTTTAQPLTLRLFTNNYTPVAASTAANFTEASGSGYAAIALTGASWTVTGGSPSQAQYAQQTFTFSGALGNVYGYYLTRTTGGEIVYAERFSDGPYDVQTNGSQIRVTPTITLGSNTSD